MLKYHIQTIEVSASTSTITFSNIPQIYSDLLVVVSDRSDRSGAVNDAVMLRCNGTNVTGRRLFGSGSSVTSTADFAAINVAGSATANTFSNMAFYISNYSSSTTTKPVSLDAVGENNATAAYQSIAAGLFNSTSPVTSIQLYQETGTNFVQYSSASLYGIKRGSDGKTEVASGGTITTSGGYTIHTFNSSGTFVANRDMDVEYLVIGGGGAGGGGLGGGGGAGGYRTSVVGATSGGGASAEPKLRVNSGTSYSVIVGAGGTGNIPQSTVPTSGSNSSFSNIVSFGGGFGMYLNTSGTGQNSVSGGSGGAGGGAGGNNREIGAAGISGQGYAGGNGIPTTATNNGAGGGGGGAGGVGANAVANATSGNGGAGLSNLITGTAVSRGGGGGGSARTSASGTAGTGTAGGGNGTNTDTTGGNGTANTGGGGGSSGAFTTHVSGNGGSGVVIIRYLTPA